VAIYNDSIEVQPGVFRTYIQTGVGPNSNGGARPLCFANDGTVALKPSFSDGSAGIITVRIGSLTGIPGTVSQAAGGIQNLYVNAGAAHAGEIYLVLGSVTGTMPGTQIGPFLLPLNFDFYTDLTFQNANTLVWLNTFGVLNSDGRAVAQIAIPPAISGILGIVLNHAYGVIGGGNNLVFVSEAARLEIVP
jgi:hypothetical protein